MWTIYLHQLHDNLRSLRFQVSLAVLMLFFVCNGMVYTMKVERLNTEDRAIEADDERRYERVESTAGAADNWYKIMAQERGTEFIAEAGFNWFQSSFWVNPSYGNWSGHQSTRTTNNWMRRFEVLDWTLIVRYVLSFLCVVLAYNAVSAELESGTLRLALANPLARGAFLLGKFLAHLTTLVVATLLGSLLSLAIMAFGGLVELDGVLWRSYLMFVLAAVFFAALFLLLSTGVSVLARNSASALVFLVTAWTVLIVVIPQASYLIATQTVDSVGRYWEPINRRENEARAALEREGTVPRASELAARDGYATERRFVQRMEEVDKELNQMARQAEKQKQAQYRMAMSVSLLSPGYAFQYSVEAFLGAGVQWMEHFGEEGARYRKHLQDFVRSRDAADPDSPHVYFLSDYMSQKELDPALIPRFQTTSVPFSTRMANGVVPMVVLVLETALAFFFALWAFNRADLAGGE
jgi:ABC-type transport system involved in multi-copper enzyme maturation permease subunit